MGLICLLSKIHIVKIFKYCTFHYVSCLTGLVMRQQGRLGNLTWLTPFPWGIGILSYSQSPSFLHIHVKGGRLRIVECSHHHPLDNPYRYEPLDLRSTIPRLAGGRYIARRSRLAFVAPLLVRYMLLYRVASRQGRFNFWQNYLVRVSESPEGSGGFLDGFKYSLPDLSCRKVDGQRI